MNIKKKFNSESFLESESDSITIDYDKAQKLVGKMIAPNEHRLTFSIFKTIKDMDKNYKNWIIRIPNIKSKEPVLKGKVVFKSYYGYQGNTIINPTWKEILIEANNAAQGDHVFLESFEVAKVKDGIAYVDMWFGS